MRRALLLLAALAACACGRRDPTAAVYRDPGGLFTVTAPRSWRVVEVRGSAQRVSFFGPVSGPAPYSASITFYDYSGPGAQYRTAEEYAAAQELLGAAPAAPRGARLGSREVYELRTERSSAPAPGRPVERRVEDAVLIPRADGFLAAVHSAPAAVHPRTEPFFRKMLGSLSLEE